MEEDYMSVYLKGRYDERDVWRKLIKLKIEDVNDKLNWVNSDEVMYATKVLKELLKGEIND